MYINCICAPCTPFAGLENCKMRAIVYRSRGREITCWAIRTVDINCKELKITYCVNPDIGSVIRIIKNLPLTLQLSVYVLSNSGSGLGFQDASCIDSLIMDNRPVL
jgi:hypothetical protein